MYDQNQPNPPPDALTQRFWQAWREQKGTLAPRLAHLLLQRGRQLLERFQHFHHALELLPRPQRRRWQRKLGASLAGVALTLALSGAPAAHAFPPPTANALINGTPCDLIEAIDVANTDTSTLTCPATVSGLDTITLLGDVEIYSANLDDNGLPVITSQITIEGDGYTIFRSGSAAEDFRIFEVATNGDLTLNNTTISGAGGSFIFGGGIENHGALSLNNSTLSGNTSYGGGGIFNYGALTLSNSTVSGNSAFSLGGGGGILNVGTLTLTNSTISGNTSVLVGGGITNSGTLILSNSTVSGNTSPEGGGIHNGGTLTLSNSTVSGNNSTGGTYGSGGALFNIGNATLTNSTLSGNSALAGGGIHNEGTLTLSDSTVSGNSAALGGAIINRYGTLTLARSLISGNSASSYGGHEIFNFVGCLSAAAADAPTCLASASAINSADLNLFGHSGLTTADAFYGFTPDGDDIVATSDGTTPTALAAILDTTLQVNAPGDTATQALATGSPAVDAATSGPAMDQRGVSRPQGGGFDIGAYELEQASNQSPVGAANSASVTVNEGQTATNTGTVSDPDGDAVTLSASAGTVVNNGDGTWSWSFNTTDGPPQSQTVTITADDGNGGVSNTTFGLTVNNVAPSVGIISAPVNPQQVGATVNASAGFSDPGTGDTHTATWDWGDGNSSAGTVGSGTVGPDSHTYTTPGIYTVQLTVTDDDGGMGQSIYQYVVVYDPAGGFVTGGGWITLPAGAYTPDPSLTGKANFGFNSKYKKGQSTPDGNTQFQFQVANLNFKSTSYEWLVVAGSHAKYKGVGTINGSGNYGFMLTATDGQISGGGGIDKFRIKIWDKNNGDAVVYDNQLGQGDDSNAGTALGGGSIVIHKGRLNGAAVDEEVNAQANRIFLPVVTR